MHNKTQKQTFVAAIFWLAILFVQKTALAHPWVQHKGSTHIVNSTSLMQDSVGHKFGPGPTTLIGIRHTMLAERGITNNSTMGVKLTAMLYGLTEKIQIQDPTVGSSGLSVYFRQKVFEWKGLIFSIEPQIKMPSFYQETDIGKYLFEYNNGTAIDIRAVIGYGWQGYVSGTPGMSHNEGFHAYFGASYRHRTNVPADMITLEGSFGINIGSHITLMAQFRKVYQLHFSPNGEASSIDSYHLFTLTTYFVTHITLSTSIAIGLVFDIGANIDYMTPNAYKGSGLTIGFWSKF